MNIPPKYEDVVAQLEAERELHKIATETLGQFADENQKLHAYVAALREELGQCGSMAAMIEDKELAEHAGSGPVSSRVESAFTQLHNELSELRESYESMRDRKNSIVDLQQRLTVAEQRNASITGKVSSCKDCGSSDLFWFAQNTVPNGIQHNRLNTHDVECLFFLGCNHCSATLKQVSADRIAEKITAALKPAAEGEGS